MSTNEIEHLNRRVDELEIQVKTIAEILDYVTKQIQEYNNLIKMLGITNAK